MNRFCWIICFCLLSNILYSESAPELSFHQQDPYEHINRKIHNFNMAFDATFLKPPATLYYRVIPAPVRSGINNFYTNLQMLPSMANDILQGDWRYTIKDFWRFFINSTLGFGGIFDVAALRANLPPHVNDLGLTFAKWGNRTSPYIVIPFLGPSTIRDGVAMLFDYTFFTPYPYLENQVLIYSLLGVRYVDLRSQLIEKEPLLKQSLDPYSFIRDAYLQHRQFVINGRVENSSSIYLEEE